MRNPHAIRIIILFSILPFWGIAQDQNSEEEALLSKALSFCELSHYDSVLVYLEPALQSSLDRQDEEAWYGYVKKVGKALRKSGEEEASNHFRRYARQANGLIGDQYILGKVYMRTADQLKRQGYFHESLNYFDQALKLFEVVGKKNTMVATTYRYAGNIHTRKGNYQEAIAYLGKALEILKNEEKEEHLGKTYSDLGLVYTDLKDYQTAKSIYRQGLNLEKLSDRQRGILLVNLAGIYRETDQLDSALTLNESAFRVFQKAEYVAGLGVCAQLKGELKALEGKHFEALKAYQIALDHTLEVRGQHHREVAKVYVAMQGLYLDIDQPDNAVSAAKSALIALLPELEDQDVFYIGNDQLYAETWLVHALKGYARSLSRLPSQHPDTLKIALETYEQAFEVSEKLRDEYSSDWDRSSLLDHHLDAYAEAIELACRLAQIRINDEQHYLKVAFSIANRSRAFNLYKALSYTWDQLGTKPPDSLLERGRSIEQQISKNYRAHRVAMRQGGMTASGYDAKMDDLNLQQRQLDELIESNYPEFSRIAYQRTHFPSTPLKEELGEGEVLVEYFKGPQSRYLLALTRERYFFCRLASNSIIDSLVAELWTTIAFPPNRMAKREAQEKFSQPAGELYSHLLKPLLEDQQVNAEKLIIIPDAELARIPFDVLLMSPPEEGQGFKEFDYLLRKYTVSYHYSADLFSSMQGRGGAETSRDRVLFFGPEVTADEEISTSAPHQFAEQAYTSNLPGSTREMEAIARFFDGNFMLGGRALGQPLKDLVKDYNILHLSAHSRANLEDPMNSYVQLANEDRLYAFELHGMLVSSKLVILNGCETGAGKADPGEGTLSLGRAFLYAGFKSVVTNLWSVDDVGSATVVEGLYGELANGLTLSQALRQAKLQALESGDGLTAHPYFWAGGMSIGEAKFEVKKVVASTGVPRWWWVGVLLIPLLILSIRKVLPRFGKG